MPHPAFANKLYAAVGNWSKLYSARPTLELHGLKFTNVVKDASYVLALQEVKELSTKGTLAAANQLGYVRKGL